VIPPANTGSLNTKRKAVTHTLTRKRGILNQLREEFFRLFIVHKKLIDPAMDLTPAKWRLKMIISTELEECPKNLLRGG